MSDPSSSTGTMTPVVPRQAAPAVLTDLPHHEPGAPHPSNVKLYSLLALMLVLWSGNYVVGKWIMREVPAPLASGLRLFFSSVAMIPIYIWTRARKGTPRLERAEVKKLALLGLVGVGLNQVFFLLGLSRTSVGHAALIVALTPALVLLIAVLTKQEKFNRWKVAGLVVAIAGVGSLQVMPGRFDGATLLGDFLIFLCALTFSIFTVAGKNVTKHFDTVTVTTFSYCASSLVITPVALAGYLHFDFARVSWVAWISMIYMAWIPSLLGLSIYYYALKYIPASRVSLQSYLQPLMATLLAVPLLGEPVTVPLLVGGGMVMSGVFLAGRR